MKEKLTQIGLSEKEAEVYLYLLKKEKRTATVISRDIKINRSVVYSILEKLLDKGLVNLILIDNKKHFSASNPKLLEDFLKDKQILLKEILPKLSLIKKEKDSNVSVELYQGLKGGVAILKDILREEKDYISFGHDGSFEEDSETIIDQYTRQLIEKGIKERLIVKKGIHVKGNLKNSKIKFLPKDLNLPSITTVYGDKVAISIFQKPKYFILIKSKDLANTYKNLFEILWKIAK